MPHRSFGSKCRTLPEQRVERIILICVCLSFALALAILLITVFRLHTWELRQAMEQAMEEQSEQEPGALTELLIREEAFTLRDTLLLGGGLTLLCLGFTLFVRARDHRKTVLLTQEAEQLRRKEQALSRRAESDTLTGLLRTEGMRLRVNALLRLPQKGEQVLMVLDLDNFKAVNDTRGHQAGDCALLRLTECLRRLFRSDDLICRFGGDEFALLLPGLPSLRSAEEKAESLLRAVREIAVEGICLSVSVGLARAGTDGEDFDTLFQAADRALYLAKETGKGRFCWASETNFV